MRIFNVVSPFRLKQTAIRSTTEHRCVYAKAEAHQDVSDLFFFMISRLTKKDIMQLLLKESISTCVKWPIRFIVTSPRSLSPPLSSPSTGDEWRTCFVYKHIIMKPRQKYNQQEMFPGGWRGQERTKGQGRRIVVTMWHLRSTWPR